MDKKFEEMLKKETVDSDILVKWHGVTDEKFTPLKSSTFLVRTAGGNLLYIDGKSIRKIYSNFWDGNCTIGYTITITDEFGKECTIKSRFVDSGDFTKEHYSEKEMKEHADFYDKCFAEDWEKEKIKLYKEMEKEMSSLVCEDGFMEVRFDESSN